MTTLNFGRDAQGFNAFAPMPSALKQSVTLTTGVAASYTVPSEFKNYIVVFSTQPGTTVWVDFSGATAAVPAGGTFAATTSELNPGSRLIAGGSSISVISNNATADVGISLYAVP